MFNLQPGTGLGFSASKKIALGLGAPFITTAAIAVQSTYNFIKELITRSFFRSSISQT